MENENSNLLRVKIPLKIKAILLLVLIPSKREPILDFNSVEFSSWLFFIVKYIIVRKGNMVIMRMSPQENNDERISGASYQSS